MGNSSSAPKNKLKVRFTVRNFAVHGLPQKPQEWSQRIDEKMWNEFVTYVRMAATLENASERKAEYKKWFCYFWLGLALFMVGAGCGMGLGLGGGLSGNTAMWVFAIIIGIFGFIGGMILFIVSATKYGEINKEYISDVKSSVAQQLMRLNAKYANIIRFTVLGTGNNIFRNKEDANTTISIPIEVEIFTQTVQYIPDQNVMPQNAVIQQQPTMQLQAAASQGQIIMVQMPDGRMVPAQIQGQVAPQQQVVYQQPQQQQQQQQQQVVVIPQPQPSGYQQVPKVSPPSYAHVGGGGHIEPQRVHVPPGSGPDELAPFAYNPGANDDGVNEQHHEEGGEGAKPTDGRYNYQ